MEFFSTAEPSISQHFTQFFPQNVHPIEGQPQFQDTSGRSAPFYETTNEVGVESANENLRQIEDIGGECIVTLSGIHAFEQFAACKGAKYMFHIDPHPSQKILVEIFIKAVAKGASSHEAIEAFLGWAATICPAKKTHRKLQDYFQKRTRLFTHEDDWPKIKSAVMDGHIFSLCVNLRDDSQVDQFCLGLQKVKIKPILFYASNLSAPRWLGEDLLMTTIHKIRAINPNRMLYVLHARGVEKCICVKTLVQRLVLTTDDVPELPRPICLKQLTHQRDCLVKIKGVLLLFCQEVLTKGVSWNAHITPHRETAIKDLILNIRDFNPTIATKLVVIIAMIKICSVSRKILTQTRELRERLPEVFKAMSMSPKYAASPIRFAIIYYTALRHTTADE